MDCKYCFLQTYNQTPKPGKEYLEPGEMIDVLCKSNLYNPGKVIMLGSETDFFMHRRNVNYLKSFLTACTDRNLKNKIVVVTKNEIDDSFIDFINSLKHVNLTVYFSISWLPKEIEPGVNRLKLIQSLERVSQANIPTVHYWRPFIPQNSSIEIISEVLKTVSQFTNISVISGLKLNPSIKSKMVTYWPQLRKIQDSDLHKISNIWPKGVKNVIKSIASAYFPEHRIFETNSCAICSIDSIPDYNQVFETAYCTNNICGDKQRKMCKQNAHSSSSEEEIEIELRHIEYSGRYEVKNRQLVLMDDIEHGQYIHLRHSLKIPVTFKSAFMSNHEWSGIAVGNQEVEI
ncbi:hypothetical protein HC864_05290 [Candidatus Gracilibacteria bacterium]|nr:hypothetical protein [Candidatus Gracilibacteria bacterium]